MMDKFVVSLFVMIIVAFIGGIYTGYYGHPYEKCNSMYASAEDIGECIWLLRNQPALQ